MRNHRKLYNCRKRHIERLLEFNVQGFHIKGKTDEIANWLNLLHFSK